MFSRRDFLAVIGVGAIEAVKVLPSSPPTPAPTGSEYVVVGGPMGHGPMWPRCVKVQQGWDGPVVGEVIQWTLDAEFKLCATVTLEPGRIVMGVPARAAASGQKYGLILDVAAGGSVRV